MMKAAILTDISKCIGCGACAEACKTHNGLPPEDEPRALSETTWTFVKRVGDSNVRQQCMHCLEPSCASVCPVGALAKDAETGAVTYDESKCMGCRYCMVGCPFDVPRYEWTSNTPRVRKCILCHERLQAGAEPACTAACPTGATIFGDRDALLREASRRIAAEPETYVPHIYGQAEAGGTGVLYVSNVPFERLGFKVAIRNDPYPKLTWNVLSKLPNVVSVAGVGLVGLWWIIRRRDALMTGRDPGGKPDASRVAHDEPRTPETRRDGGEQGGDHVG